MLETKISYQYEKWDYFVVLTFVLTTGTIIWFHYLLSLIHISEPTRPEPVSRMPSSA